jgi:hypothetical protein
MDWIFKLFFGMLGLAILVCIVMWVIERSKPEKTVHCTLETRMREKFPYSTVVGRRDKVDYTLIFRTDDGDTVSVAVTKEIYTSIQKGTRGDLRHRGSHFISFTAEEK